MCRYNPKLQQSLEESVAEQVRHTGRQPIEFCRTDLAVVAMSPLPSTSRCVRHNATIVCTGTHGTLEMQRQRRRMLHGCMPQAKTGAYDLNGNLALLRHYSFAPETAKLDATAAVLTKAMMRLPEPDFAQLLHLIPERVQVRRRILCSVGVNTHTVTPRTVPNTSPQLPL